MSRRTKILLALFLVTVHASAQRIEGSVEGPAGSFVSTGNVNLDILRVTYSSLPTPYSALHTQYQDLQSPYSPLHTPLPDLQSPKSPLAAAFLSAAVPGLGQSYGADWTFSWKTLAFVGAEVALWTAYAVNTSKADKQTAEFERYADEHWDVTRYAGWIQTYAGQLNPQANCSNIITSTDPNLRPWDRVNWGELNRCEEEIGRVSGTGFTHRLPVRPEQQYYELIGKYAQYGGGWDDAAGFTPSDLLADRVSPRFLDYSRMRGRANDLFNVASAVSAVIVVNHLISAFEAAWSVARENKRIQTEARVKEWNVGGRVEKFAALEVSVKL